VRLREKSLACFFFPDVDNCRLLNKVILSVNCLVDCIEKGNCLVWIFVSVKLFNYIAYLLLIVVKLKVINNALICRLLIRGYIWR
jgi:hypothetical protein